MVETVAYGKEQAPSGKSALDHTQPLGLPRQLTKVRVERKNPFVSHSLEVVEEVVGVTCPQLYFSPICSFSKARLRT